MIIGMQDNHINKYVLFALIAGILNAGSQVVLHTASQKENLFTMNLWIFTIISLILLILSPFFISIRINTFTNIFINPLLIWTSLGIIIFGITAQIFRVKAFKYTEDPSFIAPGMYFSVVVAAILDIVIYHLMPSLTGWCGIVLVCGASMLSAIKNNKQKSKE